MKRKILLTGGLGTIGGRLSQHLASDESCSLRIASRGYLPPPESCPQAEMVQVDYHDPDSIAKSLHEISAIVHLAALNEPDCKSDPVQAEKVNVENTRVILNQAIRMGVERFVYLSTIQVYGTNLAGTISEASRPNPIGPYAMTHYLAEEYVRVAHESKQILGLRIRCTNGFGAPVRPDARIWHTVVNDLCRQAVRLGQLTLNSSGQQRRNFIPFADVCVGLQHLLNVEPDLLFEGLFNLGSPHSPQIIDMARLIADRCQLVLGFRPPVHTASSDLLGQQPELIIKSENLKSTGINLICDIEAEIDALLLACHSWFKEAEPNP